MIPGLAPAVVMTAAGGFTPADISPDAWYDPSDLSTLWQDTAATTPAGIGDPVARLDDLSGNGVHLLQETSSSRPTLEQNDGLYYLQFDGVDDFLSAGFSYNSAYTVFTAKRTMIANQGSFNAWFSTSDGLTANSFQMESHNGTFRINPGPMLFAEGDTDPHVFTVHGDNSSETTRFDGAEIETGSNNFSDFRVLKLGQNRNQNRHYQCRIYGLVVKLAELGAGDLADVEGWLSGKAGVGL